MGKKNKLAWQICCKAKQIVVMSTTFEQIIKLSENLKDKLNIISSIFFRRIISKKNYFRNSSIRLGYFYSTSWGLYKMPCSFTNLQARPKNSTAPSSDWIRTANSRNQNWCGQSQRSEYIIISYWAYRRVEKGPSDLCFENSRFNNCSKEFYQS